MRPDLDPPTPDTRLYLPADVPAQLGHYRLIKPAGSGAMGKVFEARHELLGQKVAIKLMRADLAADAQFVARFLREMEALGRGGGHPNLIRALYAGQENTRLYLVTEYLEGLDLDRLIRSRGRLSAAEACEIARQAALGLEALRLAGLVHRDIKPSNLFLTSEGVVKVLDLGLARLVEPQGEELTATDTRMGTYDYLAPEQADDPRRVDIRADIYSLGCTLYRLLTGAAPFAYLRSPAKKVEAHARLPIPAVPGVSDALNALLARMTAKRPEDRFATPGEVAEALRVFAQGAALPGESGSSGQQASNEATPELPAPTPTGMPTVQDRREQSRPWNWGVIVVVGLLLAGGGAWWRMGGAWGTFTSPTITGDPINAAGNMPCDLDQLAAYEPHPLLERAPVQAHWDHFDGTASRSYDAKLKMLRIHSPRNSLFHFGTTQARSYTLEVQFHQAKWDKGPGVYFGYRVEKGSPKFQYLAFNERPDNGRVFVVHRGRGTIDNSQPDWQVAREDHAGQDLPFALERAIIVIEVVQQRLKAVRVNGHDLHDLNAPEVNQVFTPADHQGALGVWCRSASCVVTRVIFTAQPDR